MLKVCNLDIENRQKVYKSLRQFIKDLKKRFRIKEVYLYGSWAKGEIHEGSDIDLVIIGNFEGRMFERIDQVLGQTDLPIEPLVYTPQEFERMRRASNPFIKQVIKTGQKL